MLTPSSVSETLSPSSTTIMNISESLSFMSSQTLAEFKMSRNASKIDIVKNPATNKIFFKCSTVSGAVSNKWTSAKPSVISVVRDNDVEFLMLHNEATVNVLETI